MECNSKGRGRPQRRQAAIAECNCNCFEYLLLCFGYRNNTHTHTRTHRAAKLASYLEILTQCESPLAEWLRDCDCDCMQTAAKRHYHWPIWMIIRSPMISRSRNEITMIITKRCDAAADHHHHDHDRHPVGASVDFALFAVVLDCGIISRSPLLLPIPLSVLPLFSHYICGASRSLSPPSTEAEAAHKFFICLVFILFRLMYFYFQLCTYFLLLPPLFLLLLLLLHLLSSFASFRVVFNIFFFCSASSLRCFLFSLFGVFKVIFYCCLPRSLSVSLTLVRISILCVLILLLFFLLLLLLWLTGLLSSVRCSVRFSHSTI